MWQHKRGEGRSVGSTFLLCIMLYTYIYIVLFWEGDAGEDSEV